MAVFNDVSKDKLILYPRQIKWSKDASATIKKDGEIIEADNPESLELEYRHFLECIDKRKATLTDTKNGLNVLKRLESCQVSLKRGSKNNIL